MRKERSKKRIIFCVLIWLCVAALCVTIFVFSSKSAVESSEQSGAIIEFFYKLFGVGFTDFFVRKLAHFSEFLLLGFLSALAFTYTLTDIKKIYLGVVFSLLYCISDEIHQIFVPGRACQFRDVLIDFSGILVGTAVLFLLYLLFKHFWGKKKCTKDLKS